MYFEQLLKSPKSNNDTLGLGYTTTEEGESSKIVEQRNDKGKNSKPIIFVVGEDILLMCVGAKTKNQHDKPKNMGHYHKYNNQGHQVHECKTRTMHAPRFEGHYYNYNKYGHRAFECRSKPMWSSNKIAKVESHGHFQNWDYNTRKSYNYYQEYVHILEKYIRTHFNGNYRRWLS